MSRIAMMKNPAKLTLTKGGIIPGNHTDKGPDPTPEDDIDTGTVWAWKGRVDEVILIPRNWGNEDTVHVRMDMPVEDKTPLRMKGLTTRPWMQWAKPCAELLGRRSQRRSSERRCRVDLHDHHSTLTMGRRTRWSTSAIISIWCPYIHTTTRWCVKFSPRVLGPRHWDGSMGYGRVQFVVSSNWFKSLVHGL